MAAKDELGRRGEDLAVAWAETRGWTVLARNWRGERGELDIVALDGECVVVLEVKTRSSTSLGGPIAAVTRQKVQRLRQLTGEWLVRGRVEWAAGSPDGACGAAAVVLSGTADIRIDVLGILWPPDATPRFEHVRGIG
ncbi:YraN family protein [Salana multivorans]